MTIKRKMCIRVKMFRKIYQARQISAKIIIACDHTSFAVSFSVTVQVDADNSNIMFI